MYLAYQMIGENKALIGIGYEAGLTALGLDVFIATPKEEGLNKTKTDEADVTLTKLVLDNNEKQGIRKGMIQDIAENKNGIGVSLKETEERNYIKLDDTFQELFGKKATPYDPDDVFGDRIAGQGWLADTLRRITLDGKYHLER